MVKRLCIFDGRLTECGIGEEQLLIYLNPEKDELKALVEKYNIDEHTLNSALDEPGT